MAHQLLGVIRMKYIKFIKTNKSGIVTYILDLTDVTTLNFYNIFKKYIAKENFEIQAIRPNGIKDYLKLYVEHSDWRWLQSFLRINIIYDNKLSNNFKVSGYVILPTFYTKAKKEYKHNYTRGEFDILMHNKLDEFLNEDTCGLQFVDE